jgi:hypothetical protein
MGASDILDRRMPTLDILDRCMPALSLSLSLSRARVIVHPVNGVEKSLKTNKRIHVTSGNTFQCGES